MLILLVNVVGILGLYTLGRPWMSGVYVGFGSIR